MPDNYNGSHSNVGSIEIICGSMFSGKTEELIRRLKRVVLAKRKVTVFKPAVDTRFDDKNIVSHNRSELNSKPIDDVQDIIKQSKKSEVIGIDEAQFFTEDLVAVCNDLANEGKRVIVAGLDMDFKGEPFAVMPNLMAIADRVTKLHAVCVDCGELANFTYRKGKSEKQVELGAGRKYSALCRQCYIKKEK